MRSEQEATEPSLRRRPRAGCQATAARALAALCLALLTCVVPLAGQRIVATSDTTDFA